MQVFLLNNIVSEKLPDRDTFNHGITRAIHQNENECIAVFYMPRQFNTKKVDFIEWNQDVKNMTEYQSESELLKAQVRRTWEVEDDWICIELKQFEM